MTGILLHYCYQFSSATKALPLQKQAQISKSEAMRKDAQVPSVAPSVASSVLARATYAERSRRRLNAFRAQAQ
jgi:hypothetical protein